MSLYTFSSFLEIKNLEINFLLKRRQPLINMSCRSSNPISRILNPSSSDNPLSKILNPNDCENPHSRLFNSSVEDPHMKFNNSRNAQSGAVPPKQNFQNSVLKKNNTTNFRHEAATNLQRPVKNMDSASSGLQGFNESSSSSSFNLPQTRNPRVNDSTLRRNSTTRGETLDEFCSRRLSEAREARDVRDMKVEAAIQDLQNGDFSCVAEAARAYNLKEKSLRMRVKASGLQLPLNPWQNKIT